MCVPEDSYEGICGAFSANASPKIKEELAWKCQASWTCLPACLKDFDGCPAGWKKAGSVCSASSDYDGICSPAMDFHALSIAQKSVWSAQCGAPWPCAASSASFAGARSES